MPYLPDDAGGPGHTRAACPYVHPVEGDQPLCGRATFDLTGRAVGVVILAVLALLLVLALW